MKGLCPLGSEPPGVGLVGVCVSEWTDSAFLLQVCDSDTVLDPACTIEMLRVLEEDPQVGGVGGDVQVRSNQGFLGVEGLDSFCFFI